MHTNEPSEGAKPLGEAHGQRAVGRFDAAPPAQPALSRRRLLRAGAGAAPVVLSFASKPAYAVNGCLSASATVSANTSRAVPQSCSADGPTTWRDSDKPNGGWPSSYKISFSSVFGPSPKYETLNNSDPSLHQVLSEDCKGLTADQQALARYLCALYLSFLKSPASVPATVLPNGRSDIKALWSKVGSGTFSPAGAGKAWGPAETNAWLSTLFATL
jgi:hypothetical protein